MAVKKEYEEQVTCENVAYRPTLVFVCSNCNYETWSPDMVDKGKYCMHCGSKVIRHDKQ